MRVDIYCNRSYALCLSCVYPEVAYKTMESIAATADQILPMVKADLGIGFVPEEFLDGVDGVSVIETKKPLPEREIRLLKRSEQPLGVAAKELEKLILEQI